jgi:serine/threonine protein kinase
MDTPRVATSVHPGALLGGKYRVVRPLGEGAMGKVVLALHEELEQQVAIKLLLGPSALDAERVERFLREAKAAAKLQSEHVVRVTDVGRFEGVGPYIVMEFLSGQDLDQVLSERGPLPTTEAVDYILEALDALAEAHAHGIVHRDLKPSNLFRAERPDGSRMIKVLDFGISKQMKRNTPREQKLTGAQIALGTPAFMAPEQLKDASDVDARADIWSLGIVLYELLTAQLPFEGNTVGELVANVLSEDPTSIAARRGSADPALEEVIRRCLQRDRGARYGNVAELAEALAPLGSGARSAELRRISALVRRLEHATPLIAPRSVPLDDEPTQKDPAVRPRMERSALAQEPTQKTWGRRAPMSSEGRQVALAAGGGIAAALVIIGVAMAAFRGPSAPVAGAPAASPVDPTSDPASSSPTSTPTPTATATATPTTTSSETTTGSPTAKANPSGASVQPPPSQASWHPATSHPARDAAVRAPSPVQPPAQTAMPPATLKP